MGNSSVSCTNGGTMKPTGGSESDWLVHTFAEHHNEAGAWAEKGA